jgi:subtilisin family serine protease
MRKISIILLAFIMLNTISCKKENNEQQTNPAEQEIQLTGKQVAEVIKNIYDLEGTFNWNMVSANVLYSAVMAGDKNVLTIGYGGYDDYPNKQKSISTINSLNEILTTIDKTEGKTQADNLLLNDEELQYVDVVITKKETIERLRKIKNIRYMEPATYNYFQYENPQKSNSGCSRNAETISSADYTTLPTGAKIPWSYKVHKIDQAWNYSKGRGITVGVIDTGVSPYQANLGSKFDDYYSGRYIQKYGTFIDSAWWWSSNYDGPDDRCGHGTNSCSSVAAPNNNNHLPVGVAYECNLVSYRGTEDVVLNDYHEKKGVTMALKALANRSDVKIISMSIGYPWSIGNIKDAVKYAYAKGKLIFAAGGTSTTYTNWYPVIFPASMSETVAVTGVEEGSGYDECDVCHKGKQIIFTYVMERGNNHHQPVVGFYNNTANYFGGSSVATASTAGIAALVWARYPSWNRDQVLNRMKWAADFYPYKHSDYGYGNINALKAVRGY